MAIRVLLSNATFLSPKRVVDYGISDAAQLVRKFGLSGLEILPRLLLTAGEVRKRMGFLPVPVVGIHFPWSWQYFKQTFRPNKQATAKENIKGFLASISQPRGKYGRPTKLARELGAEYICMHPQTFVDVCVPWERLRIEGLCFENDWPEEGYRGTYAANNFARCCGPSAGVVLDTCHLGRVSIDANNPLEAYRRVKDRLRVVHLSDYSPTLGEHLIPGHGELKWLPDFLGWLKEDGFSGPIVLEIRSERIDPRFAIEQSLKFVRRYF